MRFVILLLLLPVLLDAQNKEFAPAKTNNQTVLMPYNRSVRSAGTVLAYGNPEQENHTLDVIRLAGTPLLVVEDRYGLAVVDPNLRKIVNRWSFREDTVLRRWMSVYSGIKSFRWNEKTYIVWGAASGGPSGGVVIAEWTGTAVKPVDKILFTPLPPAEKALPNEVVVQFEGGDCFLYVVLNGNEQVLKIRFSDKKILWTAPTGAAPFGLVTANGKLYVSNWGGPQPNDKNRETAGIPWGAAYVDPRTGAIAEGSISVYDNTTGRLLQEVKVGLHPNAMTVSPDNKLLYVACGNSDDVYVLDLASDAVVQRIPVGLFREESRWAGSSPNALALDSMGRTLYVSNGLDHAVAVVRTGPSPQVLGYIPTEAYPSGLVCSGSLLCVTNLEARGGGILNRSEELQKEFDQPASEFKGAYNVHQQYASFSLIPIPNSKTLSRYTKRVKKLAQAARIEQHKAQARPGIAPRPVPERTGEPSVFRHVVFIIKENRTYDQVFGDIRRGRGRQDLCIFGDSVTPNQHRLVQDYVLLDNYYASGKSSAEGHQWTDAGIVSDYVQKSVRAWFRSYPHRQYDAMVYTKDGFIWNHALDHGKSVRIYGEACFTEFDETKSWSDIYNLYINKKPFIFKNTTTISRVAPILSQNFPGYDNPKINDQLRADAFIAELQNYEKMPGDSLPNLMVIALPNDHTAGTSPGYPTPRAQVADNDLALGKIVDALSKSRFWPNTVVFVTEDDSQGGWDHISGYRTTALVISPYTKRRKLIHTNYNQTSMLRTIELILGLPPMNIIDATARPMTRCFTNNARSTRYDHLANRIPLNELNPRLSSLQGKALYYAQQSLENMTEQIDGGEDDLMNRILWYWAKGETAYPE